MRVTRVRRRSGVRRALGGGVLLAGALGVWACCAAPSAAEVERRLLALDKNARLRGYVLERRTVEAEIAGARPRTPRVRPVEVIALRVGPNDACAAARGERRAPVLLVHGTPGTLSAWVDVALGGAGSAGLAGAREVVALEVLGHGFAPGAPGAPERFDFALGARFVALAAEALGLDGAHLVGHSYGGEFAWRAARDAPELFASLTLIDSAGLPRAADEFLPEEVAMREHRLAKLGWLLNSPARVRTALAPHFRTLSDDVLAEFVLSAARPATWHAMVDLVRDESGARAADLAGLALPTLLLWGEHDLAYPPERFAREFARRIPGARLEILPGVGHYPHQEQPEAVVARLERFFADVESAASSRPER
jgi:pimeloyl-ACP methyl ester carboxylesterase